MIRNTKTTDKEDSETSRRYFLKTAGAAGAAVGLGSVAGCLQAAQQLKNRAESTDAKAVQDGATQVQVKQDAGRLVYWVLPGKRRLSKKVFGTPDNPKSLVKPVIEKAKKPAVKQLLQKFPILVGVPLKKRAVKDGEFTTTTFPTPFSDSGRVIDGEFDITYVDRQQKDTKPPTKTKDELQVDRLRFTGPKQNNYEIEFKTMFQPPIPGYKTDGGIFTDAFHHGLTGTGSPLMPKVYTYGASYSLGNVIVNGEVTDKRKVIHFMTTQTVRDNQYRLVTDEELPLKPQNTIAGQVHHTHLIIQPVTITKQGKPKFEPLQIPPKQPFIHVMFEEDTIEKAPFEPQFKTEFETPTETTTETAAKNVIDVRGREYTFDPEQITVEKGRQATVRFRNVGTISHNFELPTFGVETKYILPGQTASATFTPDRAGKFTYICGVPGHAEQGMRGTLVVTPSNQTTTGQQTTTEQQ